VLTFYSPLCFVQKFSSYALMPELRQNIDRVYLSFIRSVFVATGAEGNKTDFFFESERSN
jgi:hypothetical protein